MLESIYNFYFGCSAPKWVPYHNRSHTYGQHYKQYSISLLSIEQYNLTSGSKSFINLNIPSIAHSNVTIPLQPTKQFPPCLSLPPSAPRPQPCRLTLADPKLDVARPRIRTLPIHHRQPPHRNHRLSMPLPQSAVNQSVLSAPTVSAAQTISQ